MLLLYIISGAVLLIGLSSLVSAGIYTLRMRVVKPPAVPTPKKGLGCGAIIGMFVVIPVLICIWLGYFPNQWRTLTGEKHQSAFPKELWTLRWTLPPGITEHGKNQCMLTAEVTQNNSNVLWIVLHDKNSSGSYEKVGGMTLSWVSNDLVGTWSNYNGKDGGNAYLTNNVLNGTWSGEWEHKDKTKTRIDLKK